MSHPVELVIFDCDGVLVDSERIAVRVEVAMLAELGWPLTEAEVIERFVGRSEAYQIAAIEARLGPRLPHGWEDNSRQLYRAALEAELAPVDGVVEALAQITTANCVASSSSHERIRYALGLTGLDERFGGRIFSADEVAAGKPAPDLFLHAAARLGVEPAGCVVIEDSRYGVEAARAAGMRAFGYAGGVTPGHRLEGARHGGVRRHAAAATTARAGVSRGPGGGVLASSRREAPAAPPRTPWGTTR